MNCLDSETTRKFNVNFFRIEKFEIDRNLESNSSCDQICLLGSKTMKIQVPILLEFDPAAARFVYVFHLKMTFYNL